MEKEQKMAEEQKPAFVRLTETFGKFVTTMSSRCHVGNGTTDTLMNVNDISEVKAFSSEHNKSHGEASAYVVKNDGSTVFVKENLDEVEKKIKAALKL